MTDGSSMGIDVRRALDTVLGGADQPDEAEHQTTEQVRERIAHATADSYEGCAEVIARVILRVLEADESTHSLPLDPPRAFVMHGTGETIGTAPKGGRIVRNGTFTKTDWKDEPEGVYVDDYHCMWDTAKEQASPAEVEAFENATGFMAGFAFNQARWLLDLPPAPNPAIIEIGGSQDDAEQGGGA